MHVGVSGRIHTPPHMYTYVGYVDPHTQTPRLHKRMEYVCITCRFTHTDPLAYAVQYIEAPSYTPINSLFFHSSRAQYLPHAEVTGRSACLTLSRIPQWLAPAIPPGMCNRTCPCSLSSSLAPVLPLLLLPPPWPRYK